MSLFLIAYDIPLDRRRHKVAKALARLGKRLQYSVFVTRRGSVASIAETLSKLIEPTEDKVLIQPLCIDCDAKAEKLGIQQADLPAGFRVL